MSLFTVIPRSWKVFWHAWKADFVAIHGNPAILESLLAGLEADFVNVYGNPAILEGLLAGLEGRFCRYLW